MSFSYNGTQWNRFTGGGMTAHPTEYTIAAWIRPKSKSARNICVRSNGSPAGAWSHQLRTTDTYFQHYTYDGGIPTVTGTTAYSIDRWYHVAATAKNSGVIRLYVNGREDGPSTALGGAWAAGNDFWVSSASSGFSAYIGELVDLCIWYKELTQNEIFTIASKVRFTPLQVQRQDIRLYIPMNDVWSENLVSSNWVDLSGYSNTQTRTGTPTCIGDEISYP